MNSIHLVNWLDGGGLLAGVLLTVALLAVGHWFPWVRPLSLIRRYVYGVASIVAGFTVWRLVFGLGLVLAGLADWSILVHELRIPGGLLVISAAGGAAVVWGYHRDTVARKMRQAERGEKLLDSS